jgi:hypothetical protein
MAIDSSNRIHIVWHDFTPNDFYAEIYYKRSTDGGTTWLPAQRMTWTSGSSFSPAIAAVSSQTIHVVWDDDTPGNNEVYYKKSTNGGANWSPAKRLSWTSGQSAYSALVIDSTNAVMSSGGITRPAIMRFITRAAQMEARPGARLKD